MNFKQWLYNEAFELPFDNIRKIYEYYEESYKKYLKAPRTKIPPKTIPLDLSGSKYDFLQYLSPYVEVSVKGYLPNPGIYYGISKNHLIAGVPDANIGKISLCFRNHQYVSYTTIEHEVLHFIQDLIKIHADNIEYARYEKEFDKMIADAPEAIRSKLKKQSFREFQRSLDRKKSTYGGLPPMPLVKKIIKDKQIDIDGYKKERRIKHAHRPIEFYTNLNSLIRSLQYYYVLLGIELGRDLHTYGRLNKKFRDLNVTWDSLAVKKQGWLADYDDPEFIKVLSEWVGDKRKKKFFFNILVERKDHVVRNLEKIKNLDEELYKIYLREIYKNFINNDNFASNASEVKKIIDSMEQSKKEKEIEKSEKKRKKAEKKEKSFIRSVLRNF